MGTKYALKEGIYHSILDSKERAGYNSYIVCGSNINTFVLLKERFEVQKHAILQKHTLLIEGFPIRKLIKTYLAPFIGCDIFSLPAESTFTQTTYEIQAKSIYAGKHELLHFNQS